MFGLLDAITAMQNQLQKETEALQKLSLELRLAASRTTDKQKSRVWQSCSCL